jgi:transcription antitermination factor NusG
MHGILRDYCWYAVQVKATQELKVAASLKLKGYDTFVPLCKRACGLRPWTKNAQLALFPTYAFCRFDSAIKSTIVTTPGVIRIVGYGNSPIAIDAHEIECLKIASSSGLACTPHPFGQIGQKVIVISGPLKGVTGVLSGEKRDRVVLSVQLVQASAMIEVEESCCIAAAA